MYISMIYAPKASSKGRSISCESPTVHIQNPLSEFLPRGVDVLRTGSEPVRTFLSTGFSCYSCFYTSRLHP